MKEVDVVFYVINFREFGTGKKELIQSKKLSDVAHKNNVKHFVLASIFLFDDNPVHAHFVNKYETEKYVRNLGKPFPFLCTVYFLDNMKPGADGDKALWAF